jgi:type IV secretory pathway VirJ component
VKTTLGVVLVLLIVNLTVADATEESFKIEPFGTVALYYNSQTPSHVVLFVSGDGGWNLGVVDMARALAGLDALVAGVDMTHYIKNLEGAAGPCSYPASDFELLSKMVQKKLDFPDYVTPVLVGYSSGAHARLRGAGTSAFEHVSRSHQSRFLSGSAPAEAAVPRERFGIEARAQGKGRELSSGDDPRSSLGRASSGMKGRAPRPLLMR